MKAPLPANEKERLDALRRYEILDTICEQSFDDITLLATLICKTPIALISLVDEDRQWFKSRRGVTEEEMPRDTSFCAHAILQPDVFVVEDAQADPRFANSPLVMGAHKIRFYAGAPIISPDGYALGALCVEDQVSRNLSEYQREALRALSRQVMAHLELRRTADCNRQIDSQSSSLVEALCASEMSYRRLFEAARDGVLILHYQTGRITDVNPFLTELLGYSRQEMLGKTVAEISPTKDLESNQAMSERLKIEGFVRYDDLPLQAKDGRTVAVEFVSNLYEVAGDSVIQCNIRDITERNKLQIAMARLAAIVTFSEDAIIGKDLDGVINSWNRGAEKIFGYTSDEMVGTSIRRLIPENLQDEEDHILETISRGESVEHFQTVRQTKNGQLINVSVTASPIKDSTGKCVGVSKVARDITEAKRSEARLRKFASTQASILNALPAHVALLDHDGVILSVNEHWRKFAVSNGIRMENFCVGQNYTEICERATGAWAEEGTAVAAGIKQVLQGEIGVFDIEYPCHSPTVERWFLLRVVRVGKDREASALVMHVDITERKKAEKQVADQASLLDKAQDAIVVLDMEGKILFWNKGAERLYGWTRDEVQGRNVSELFYNDVKQFEEANRLTMSKGEWSGELTHFTKDRRKVVVESRRTLIRDDAGSPKSLLVINTNITEKKKIEAQFMRAQRMESIGTLAGGVAHDLNNILAPILMSIDILKSESDSPRTKEILDTIETSAKRGADIVRQVLSFARGVEGERVEIQPKHLLRDLEKIIKETFPKDIRLKFVIPNDTWTIVGDPTQVHQILLNLCVNARDAMPNGGTLTFSAENSVVDAQYAAMNIEAKPGRYVQISVTDTGTGIPPNILEKIFEPFFTTKELGKGTGLGLSTVKALVKSHDGFINVYSEPSDGTIFRVYLQAMEASPELRKAQTQRLSLPRGRGETILVVDDEASILTITSQTLQAFGYRVLRATDGAEALAVYAAHKNEIAVVLTDMMMPVLDGRGFIRALRRMNPSVNIIAASGVTAEGAVAKATQAGVKFFLSKPYTAETLLKTLQECLHQPE